MNSNSKRHLGHLHNSTTLITHLTTHYSIIGAQYNSQCSPIFRILQNLLCLVAVNAVYNSGQQCNKEGKEKKVFAIFEAELALFAEQKGRWSAMKEFTPMECPRDQIRQATKNSPLTSEKIWERGMTMRRDLVNWLSEYGKILNFTLIKPIVDENDDTEANKESFDIEHNEDSGGSADTELRKILQKVTFTRNTIGKIYLSETETDYFN
jgi:hypothetical protein